ncbi:MAG: EamA family transporter [Sulfuricaulis sp.]
MTLGKSKQKMWILYAILSAVMAALVAIFAKAGLRDIDPVLATTLRSIIMMLFLLGVTWGFGKFDGFSFTTVSGKEWLLLVLAGIAGASSWLFYFLALRDGNVTAVVAIDRLSIVFVVVLAAVFLSEIISWRTAVGAVLMVLGAVLISIKEDQINQWWMGFLRLVK